MLVTTSPLFHKISRAWDPFVLRLPPLPFFPLLPHWCLPECWAGKKNWAVLTAELGKKWCCPWPSSKSLEITSPIYRTRSYAEWSGPNFEHGNAWLSGISRGCTWSHCHCSSQLETLHPNPGLVFSSPLSCTNLHQPCFQHHHLCFRQHHLFSLPPPFFDPIEVCFIFIYFLIY